MRVDRVDRPELWGHCDPCARWFFVPLRADGQRPTPEEHRITCPVCVMPAGRFESREPSKGLVAGTAVPEHAQA